MAGTTARTNKTGAGLNDLSSRNPDRMAKTNAHDTTTACASQPPSSCQGNNNPRKTVSSAAGTKTIVTANSTSQSRIGNGCSAAIETGCSSTQFLGVASAAK